MLSKLFRDFFNSEKAGGIVLIICTIVSLTIANTTFGESYINFWNTDFQHHSITHWINDGLMAIFFLLIGLELEREVYVGELSNFRNALLPVIAAIGGVIVPAAIYLIFNYGTPAQSGAGIPMATDIAFAIGVLALMGSRVPASMKIFLTALAVIDDLCAIIVIAIFYATTISFLYLGIALAIFGVLLLLGKWKVFSLWIYIIGGILMWYCMLKSGVHASIAGVLLAFAIPFGDGSEKSPSYKMQHALHKPVAFIIVPLFALANTALPIPADWMSGLTNNGSIGIITGLAAGKPLGIMLFASIAVFTGLSKLPFELQWKHLLGVGLLGGIGFTMSIFVTLLAFDDPQHIAQAKIAVMIASLLASVAGLIFLSITLEKRNNKQSKGNS